MPPKAARPTKARRGRPPHDDLPTAAEWRTVHAVQHGALAGKENTMADSLALGPSGQISGSVRNIEEAQAWYGKVLGIPHLYTFGKLAFFDCGGTRLMLSQTEQTPAADSMIYLRVANIAKAHDELKARGVEFTNAPHRSHKHADGTEEWMAFFKDPEGRPLGIMSRVKP